jgi:hypothetical protein
MDTTADVRSAEIGIESFNVLSVHRAESCLGFFQGRFSLDLNELVLEIAARKGAYDQIALL